jgi:transcription antitermination factor NusB
MKRREQARQIALQALYQLDMRREEIGTDIVEFLRESTKDPEVYFFARRLAEGAWGWRAEADKLISEAAEHWRIDRMAVIDRNILRLSAYEISQCADIPPRVAIDQAIELAKRFSAAESGAFVNGILDRILRTVKGDEAAEQIRNEPTTPTHTEVEGELEPEGQE